MGQVRFKRRPTIKIHDGRWWADPAKRRWSHPTLVAVNWAGVLPGFDEVRQDVFHVKRGKLHVT